MFSSRQTFTDSAKRMVGTCPRAWWFCLQRSKADVKTRLEFWRHAWIRHQEYCESSVRSWVSHTEICVELDAYMKTETTNCQREEYWTSTRNRSARSSISGTSLLTQRQSKMSTRSLEDEVWKRFWTSSSMSKIPLVMEMDSHESKSSRKAVQPIIL